MDIIGRPLRAVGVWTGEHPLRTAGGVGAVVAGVVMALALSGDGAVTDVTLAGVVYFAVTRPAYPALLVGGLAALLFFDG